MSVNIVEKWNPTRKDDIALKEALQSLQKSTDSVLLSPTQQQEEDEEEKRFLLQGHSYFAVKAYVLTGKEFPVNDKRFDEKYPAKAFARLLPLDSNVHAETKKGLVAVGSSCTAFYNDKLQNIVTWSKTTLEYLTDNEDMNLYDFLMVLSDLKYQKPEDRDEAFHEALVGARGSLKLLQHEAEEGKRQANDLMNDLDKFRDATVALQPQMSALIHKYTAGPKPYLNYLNEEHQRRAQEETKSFADYNSTYDEWKSATGLAIGGSWKRLWNQYETLKRENADEHLLIESMNNMVKQFDGLEGKIQDAIKAVGVLSLMFQKQSESYEMIRSSLSGMGVIVSEEDAETRNLFIKSQIKAASKKLKQLEKAAAGFVKAILTETSLG
ncbi:hypothetical protein G7Z17_g1849 [Cylindrodendrum hubeiense]|uniref:Uncharacterized protein n=1 Tax=Cylindrodendrum hubeiense TaxID=595255 RepID=A0A9P5HPH9_9HYPO|nr:hypothetical protein G7Z17_g1849 [Cylindrodendrum hubeiense]